GTGAPGGPVGDWAKRYGCYLPDRVTPFPGDQLPLARAIRGEEVEETEIFVRNAYKPDGVWLRVKAGPLRDETGAVRGGLSVIRDVTQQKEAERRLAAQYAVTRVLAESNSLREAAPKILRALCECVDWQAGALWTVDRHAKVLRCVDVWTCPDMRTSSECSKEQCAIPIAEFAAATRNLACGPGVGLPGRIWANRASAWVADVT